MYKALIITLLTVFTAVGCAIVPSDTGYYPSSGGYYGQAGDRYDHRRQDYERQRHYAEQKRQRELDRQRRAYEHKLKQQRERDRYTNEQRSKSYDRHNDRDRRDYKVPNRSHQSARPSHQKRLSDLIKDRKTQR